MVGTEGDLYFEVLDDGDCFELYVGEDVGKILQVVEI